MLVSYFDEFEYAFVRTLIEIESQLRFVVFATPIAVMVTAVTVFEFRYQASIL
jgi:hypothetical protein